MVTLESDFIRHSREIGVGEEVEIPVTDGVVMSGTPLQVDGQLQVNGSLTETGGEISLGDNGEITVGDNGSVRVV